MSSMNKRMSSALVLAMAMILGAAALPGPAHAAPGVNCTYGGVISCDGPLALLGQLLARFNLN